MTVKLREKAGTISRPAGQPVPEVVGMQHDGSQATATGIVVWAGSEGKTLNLQYRGGDSNDWVIVDPGHEEGSEYRIISAGGWLLSNGTEMWLTQGLGPYEIAEAKGQDPSPEEVVLATRPLDVKGNEYDLPGDQIVGS